MRGQAGAVTHSTTRATITYVGGTQIFHKLQSHLKVLWDRRGPWSEFHAEEQQILGSTVQNLVTKATDAPHLCTTAQTDRRYTGQNILLQGYRTYSSRAQIGTQHSLLSHFFSFFLLLDPRLYIVQNMCRYIVQNMCRYIVQNMCRYFVQNMCRYFVQNMCRYFVQNMCRYFVQNMCRYFVQNMCRYFDVFLTVHHSIDFSKYQLSAQFF